MPVPPGMAEEWEANPNNSERIDLSDDPTGEITPDAAKHFGHDHHTTLQALHKMIGNQGSEAFVGAIHVDDDRNLPIAG